MADGRNLLTTMTLTAILAVLVYATFTGSPRVPAAPDARQIASEARQIAALQR